MRLEYDLRMDEAVAYQFWFSWSWPEMQRRMRFKRRAITIILLLVAASFLLLAYSATRVPADADDGLGAMMEQRVLINPATLIDAGFAGAFALGAIVFNIAAPRLFASSLRRQCERLVGSAPHVYTGHRVLELRDEGLAVRTPNFEAVLFHGSPARIEEYDGVTCISLHAIALGAVIPHARLDPEIVGPFLAELRRRACTS